jgi:hypothetical protein
MWVGYRTAAWTCSYYMFMGNYVIQDIRNAAVLLGRPAGEAAGEKRIGANSGIRRYAVLYRSYGANVIN